MCTLRKWQLLSMGTICADAADAGIRMVSPALTCIGSLWSRLIVKHPLYAISMTKESTVFKGIVNGRVSP